MPNIRCVCVENKSSRGIWIELRIAVMHERTNGDVRHEHRALSQNFIQLVNYAIILGI